MHSKTDGCTIAAAISKAPGLQRHIKQAWRHELHGASCLARGDVLSHLSKMWASGR